MSDGVILRHLAPVRHVPRGGRVERWSLVTMETPAIIPAVGAGEVRQVAEITEGGYGNSPIPVFGHGGRLWYEAGSAAALRDVLSGRAHEGVLANRKRDAFNGTPWKAFSHVGIEPAESLDTRRVVDDRSERASAEATRFALCDVLVAGEVAYMRMRGPMIHPTMPDYSQPYLTPIPFIRHRIDTSGMTDVASIARVALLMEHVGSALGNRHAPEGLALPRLAGIDPDNAGVEDVRIMAGLLAWRSERIVDSSLRTDAHSEDSRRRLRQAREALSKWVVSGGVGIIATDEMERVFSCVAETMQSLRDAVPGIEAADTRIRHATAYVAHVAMPALQARKSIAASDADALMDLAP
jgi:hypothetical protein